MPPKRKVATAESLSDVEESSQSQSATKKAKAASDTGLAANGQPTNKATKPAISLQGFKYYIEAEDPDILVLTETKVNSSPQDGILDSRFNHRKWAISDKKSYSGTALLSKHKPITVSTDLPGHPDPTHVKGRIITFEFRGCYIVATYVTNAGQGLKTLSEKNTWNQHFTTYIRDLDKKKPVIWMGDLNVAPTAKDLANPKSNWNKTPGYTKNETEAFERILNPAESEQGAGKFVDVWRHMHPDDQHYTYFSYRFNCRSKGIGWRLDMFVVSERILEKVKMCEIRSEIYGASDHVPVVMEIEDELVMGMS
ncbi:Endonuclease/exonuclease/phosphatase [Scleroderma yunnanense]